MIFYRFTLLLCLLCLVSACKKADTIAPEITLLEDTVPVHYLHEIYTDPGATVLDNHSCELGNFLSVANYVDIDNYGTYRVVYAVADASDNLATAERKVDIVLRTENYFHLTYAASDTCTSGNYFYNGLIQDCACEANAVTVANISNFGLSAIFTLPISGVYNEILTLDTTKAAITFNGFARMSTNADTLFWNYTIADSVTSDVCRSVWIKQ
ncbi:MAG: immunoglobulin-like domain-containing protein [Chitinophagales bacterium]